MKDCRHANCPCSRSINVSPRCMNPECKCGLPKGEGVAPLQDAPLGYAPDERDEGCRRAAEAIGPIDPRLHPFDVRGSLQDAAERERGLSLTTDIIAGAIHASRGRIGVLAAATAAAERIFDNVELRALARSRPQVEAAEIERAVREALCNAFGSGYADEDVVSEVTTKAVASLLEGKQV